MNYVKRLFKYMYGQGYTESRRPRAPFVFSIYIKSPPRMTRHRVSPFLPPPPLPCLPPPTLRSFISSLDNNHNSLSDLKPNVLYSSSLSSIDRNRFSIFPRIRVFRQGKALALIRKQRIPSHRVYQTLFPRPRIRSTRSYVYLFHEPRVPRERRTQIAADTRPCVKGGLPVEKVRGRGNHGEIMVDDVR